MNKTLLNAALFAVMASASLTAPAQTNQKLIAEVANEIKTRYIPMGLNADEIAALLRPRMGGEVTVANNKNGTVTFSYQRSDDKGTIVEMGQIFTGKLKPKK